MPLHADAEPVVFDRLVGFDDSVRCRRTDAELRSELIDAHVVVAVHSDFAGAVHRVHPRAGDDVDDVPQRPLDVIAVLNRTCDVFRDVLEQSPAADDVDGLHSRTDRENRQSHLDRHLRQSAIEIFATGRHRLRGRMLVEAESLGIEIERRTGEHDTIALAEQCPQVAVLGERRHDHRDASRRLLSFGSANLVVATTGQPRQSNVLGGGGAEVGVDGDDRFRSHAGVPSEDQHFNVLSVARKKSRTDSRHRIGPRPKLGQKTGRQRARTFNTRS